MHPTLLLAVALLPIIGCHHARRFQIAGRVTLDGQPLAAATVAFTSQRGPPLFAETDADGNYEVRGQLSCKETTAQYVIRVTTGGEMLNELGESIVVAERVPARYNEHTGLRMQVTPGSNRQDLALATGDMSRSRRE